MDNMKGFGMMIQELKKNPKTIVFTEGTDERILEAASRLLAGSFLTPILVGINLKPTEDQLAEIAWEVAECGKHFGIDPKVAFLSYSTLGSGKGEDVDKMRNAAAKAKELYPSLPIEGELQFDAAVSPRVARTKCPNSEVAGQANTFIFPDINAGNIGYKIAQRLGNFDAYGPILLGLNAPINDLSRGCNAEEVYSMAIITAALVED